MPWQRQLPARIEAPRPVHTVRNPTGRRVPLPDAPSLSWLALRRERQPTQRESYPQPQPTVNWGVPACSCAARPARTAPFSEAQMWYLEDRSVLQLRAVRSMRRREFMSLLGGAVATWPLAARAQQPESMPRVAFLTGLSAEDPEGQARLAAFLGGLSERGWRVGRNLQMEYRAAGRDSDRYR